MARRGAFKVKVIMPAKLQRFINDPDSQIQQTLKGAHKEVRQFLVKKIADKARIKSGDLARSIQEAEKGNKVFTKLVYARAVELGDYATPKNGKLLIWDRGGQTVSKKFVRTKKHPYFFSAVSEAALETLNIYDEAYKRMLESITT